MSSLEKIYQILRDDFQIANKLLVPGTRVREDLELDGDESYEFIEAIIEFYGLDWSWIDYGLYFNNEGLNPYAILSGLYLRIFKGIKKPSITLELLAEMLDKELKSTN